MRYHTNYSMHLCCFIVQKTIRMKKLVYYPGMGQTYPFSLDLYIHAEKEARAKEAKVQKERKPKFKLALGW